MSSAKLSATAHQTNTQWNNIRFYPGLLHMNPIIWEVQTTGQVMFRDKWPPSVLTSSGSFPFFMTYSSINDHNTNESKWHKLQHCWAHNCCMVKKHNNIILWWGTKITLWSNICKHLTSWEKKCLQRTTMTYTQEGWESKKNSFLMQV